MRVLLVEDDGMIGAALQQALRDSAYAVDWVRDGASALEAVATETYDIALLDLGLPGDDGIVVLRGLRGRHEAMPVIIVTARGGLEDRVSGLDVGADDYMTKPFEPRELLARMRAVLRRPPRHSAPLLDNGVVSLDAATFEARSGESVCRLTAREFACLRALMHRPGTILSRQELEGRIYGWNEEVESNAVEFLIHSVRRKLGELCHSQHQGRWLDGGPADIVRSLRARLFVGLSTLVIATDIGFGLLAYRRAAEEATELQDAVLRQVGQFAVRNDVTSALVAEEDDEPDVRVVVEEFGAARPGPLLDGVPPGIGDGVTTVGRDGLRWRLLVRTRRDGSRVGIGQSTASRDERIRDTLLQTLVPMMLLVPCLLVLVAFAIQASFRPLAALAMRLDARPTEDLRTLPTDEVPHELRPFIEAINRLLARVAQLFEQRRRFVADAAHELRTPVTALTVQADNLSRLELSTEGKQRLAALQGGIRRVAHLLEQLLSLARYEAGPSDSAPVTALDTAARMVIAAYVVNASERSVDLGFDRLEPARVRADPTTLQVMIRNLVDNALRHSPDGGRVDVEVFQNGADAMLLVSDTGPGIPVAEIDRIFDPFVRGARITSDGTGLGLSIVKTIVEACGGSVNVANRPGEPGGLVATVRLPAAYADNARMPEPVKT